MLNSKAIEQALEDSREANRYNKGVQGKTQQLLRLPLFRVVARCPQAKDGRKDPRK